MAPLTEPGSRAVLILSADVGEGHVAAARALGEDLERIGVRTVHQDGLSALGRIAQAVIRDGYRLQLRVAPWSYSAMYTMFKRVPLVRLAGETVLCRLGRRRLLRAIAQTDPMVIVSTHPAITAVLGRLRQRRRLGVPVVAPITDLADFSIWSHPGADLHLVMHPHAVSAVERAAGTGSAVLVGPLVAPRFRLPRDPLRARAQLGVASGGKLVAVSGGGWGVGDLGGATDAALAAGADQVVVVTGHNTAARAALTERFAADARVIVWGFTTKMDMLLRAADALVHSTGGVTSLEALSCGCSMVAYGASAGHIKIHNMTMARLGLIAVADNRAELQRTLSRLVAATRAPQPAAAPGAQDAAAVVAAALPRIRPLPVWRTALGAACVPVTLVTLLLGDTLGFSDPYNLAAHRLDELRPVSHVANAAGRVGVIVRDQDPTTAVVIARSLAPSMTVTFAVPARALGATATAVGPYGDEAIAALPGTAPVHWVTTRAALDHAPTLDGRRYYLVPDTGSSMGQYLLARTAKATALAGHLRLVAGRAPIPRAGAGDLVVVDPGASADATVRSLRALSRSLTPRGLHAASVSSLLSARTAGAASSTTAHATTIPTPNTTNNG